MTVACDIKECKYNGGKFCKKFIVVMHGGICGELVDRNGVQRDPQTWMKEELVNPKKTG